MIDKSNYNRKIDSLIQLPELYDEVNKALDENYSFLFAIRDLESSKYTKSERKAFYNELKHLKSL